MEKIREQINPLASDDHLQELMQQLELMGEIVVLESEGNHNDLVCVQPEWLCNQVLGRLFSHDRYYQVNPNNLNGIYTSHDLNAVFADLCANTRLLKDIFIALSLCAEWDNEKSGEPLYEFAALNFLSEPLPLAFQTVNSSAKSHKSTGFVFNGFQIKTSSYHLDHSSRLSNGHLGSSMTTSFAVGNSSVPASQFASLFYRIQVNLRYLTKNFYLDVDENNEHRVIKEKQQQIPQTPVSHPPLARKQSKLETLFETPQSPQSLTRSISVFGFNSPPITNSTSNHHHHTSFTNLTNMNGALIDIELYQTRYCSRLTRKSCRIECLVSLEHMNGQFIEVRACAPEAWREELFYFVNDLYAFIEQVVTESCPSINLEKYYLDLKPISVPNSNSAFNLGLIPIEAVYSPKDILNMELEIKAQKLGLAETKFLDVVCCGSESIEKHLVLGSDLYINQLKPYTRRTLCLLLDQVDPMGLDWSILAVKLGLQHLLPKIDDLVEVSNENGAKMSKTECVLEEWSKMKQEPPNVKNLIGKIADLGRKDVLEMILNTVDLFQINISKDSGIQNSNQTLASLK